MASYQFSSCTTDTRGCLVVGDFNGDGKETIAFAGYYTDGSGFKVNLTEFSYSVDTQKLSIIGTTYHNINTPQLKVGDVNNDGNDDLIVRGIDSNIFVYWGSKATSILGKNLHYSTVNDNYTTFSGAINRGKLLDQCFGFAVANLDGTGDALWVVEKTIIENLKFVNGEVYCDIFKAVCDETMVTIQPSVFCNHIGCQTKGSLTVAAVNFDGKDQRPRLFIDGAYLSWKGKTFDVTVGDTNREVSSYAIGNFTADITGREQLVYTYKSGKSSYTEMKFFNGNEVGTCHFNNALTVLVAVDDDSDSEIVRFNDKFYVYTEPEVFGILQAAPYYGELSSRGYQDIGWTTLSLEQSFTSSETQTSGTETQTGVGIHFKTLISSSNIGYVYTESVTQSFKNEVKKGTSRAVEAREYDIVLVARTPYVAYSYNKWDNNNNRYLENEVVIMVEQPTVYVALTIDEYNEFVADYLKANPDYASKLKKLDAIKNNIGYEGIPDSYTATTISGIALSKGFNATDTSGSSVTDEASAELTKEQSTTRSQTQTFKYSSCYGYYGLIKEFGLLNEKSWSFLTESSTSSAISTKISVSGKVCSVKGYAMANDGIPNSAMSQYGFQWELAHWKSDIPGVDYFEKTNAVSYVPVIGYIVKPVDTSSTLKTIVPPMNVKAYIDYQYESQNETGAVSIYWDKYAAGTKYTIQPTKYKVYWKNTTVSQYQFLGEVQGTDANRGFFTMPQSLRNWNGVYFVVQAINNNAESLFSQKVEAIDGGTARETDFVVTYYEKIGDKTPIATQKYDYGANLSLPTEPQAPIVPGKTIVFSGWQTNAGVAYDATKTVTEDLSLYASFSYSDDFYAVNFYDKDGVTKIKSDNLLYGAAIVAPTMENTADLRANYIFIGWSESAQSQTTATVPSTCTESKDYYAIYATNPIYYNVLFTNYLGETADSFQKKYEEQFQLATPPQKPATELYTYTFSNWTITQGSANMIDQTTYECIGDVTFEPVYVEVGKEHLVVFLDEQGNLISNVTYTTNDYVLQPQMQTKYDDNYTYYFAHWTTDLVTKEDDFKDTCQGSVTYYAVYDKEARSYTITFQNYDGSVISTSVVKYGEEIVAPENPTREEDNTYTYTFTGWGEIVGKCFGTKTYTATYSSNYKVFNVAFKDDGGNVLSNGSYHYGDVLNVPYIQLVKPQGQDEYHFSGWYKEGDATCTLVNVRNCYASATYVASYTLQPHEYTISFNDENGNVLYTGTYVYGDTIVHPTAQQMVKADDDRYRYEFIGFDKDVYYSCVGDEEYTAQYEKIAKEYIVMYQNYDESILGAGWKTYLYGEALAVPANPTRADDDNYSYRFIGWDNDHTGICTGKCLYTAQYEAIPLQNATKTKATLTSNQLFILMAVVVGVLLVAVVVLVILLLTKKGQIVIQTLNINSKASGEDKR